MHRENNILTLLCINISIGKEKIMILIKNAEVYAPKYLGKKDILIEGTKVKKIADYIEINLPDNLVETIDLSDKILIPGLIDQHVHITGGGGEAGPSSRVPESNLRDFISCGVTTVLGLMGTDGISRSLENLYAKAKALNEDGITCYMSTGSYSYPSVTLTGSVERDIYLIDLCIGVKIAVSDHRSSNITSEELIRLATEARRGGLISGKSGIVTMHMGSGKKRLSPVLAAIKESDVPVKNFIPTHVNMRSSELLEDCVEFAKIGGTMDFTAGFSAEDNSTEADKIFQLLDRGVKDSLITVSSDAFGSQPRFDEEGKCIGLTYSTSNTLMQLLNALVSKGMSLEQALKFFTVNPARVLGLEGIKGTIGETADADLVVLDRDMRIISVMSKGKIAMADEKVMMKGKFEL